MQINFKNPLESPRTSLNMEVSSGALITYILAHTFIYVNNLDKNLCKLSTAVITDTRRLGILNNH